jgi:hypothetical protein
VLSPIHIAVVVVVKKREKIWLLVVRKNKNKGLIDVHPL